jgi:hypothetical protein
VDVKHDALIFELLDKITNFLCTSYKYVEASGSGEIVASLDNSGIVFFFLHRSQILPRSVVSL